MKIHKTDIKREKGLHSHTQDCMPQNLCFLKMGCERFKWKPTNLSSLDVDQEENLLSPL